jgi:hypothetical protein
MDDVDDDDDIPNFGCLQCLTSLHIGTPTTPPYLVDRYRNISKLTSLRLLFVDDAIHQWPRTRLDASIRAEMIQLLRCCPVLSIRGLQMF